jgi:hypothetical protein
METNPTEQRLSFLIDYASGQWSMSELCERYRISRPTGSKWVKRVDEEGKRELLGAIAYAEALSPPNPGLDRAADLRGPKGSTAGERRSCVRS